MSDHESSFSDLSDHSRMSLHNEDTDGVLSTIKGLEDEHTEEDQPNLMKECYDKRIRPFIDVIDDLRKCGLDQDIDLPKIVVVGDQSSGKSSILEAISGVQLPRGTGMVTRCPLELQMKRARSGWKGFISHGRNDPVTLYSPDEVQEAISEAQEQIVGARKLVKDTAITLRIESPDSPDLSLIDLPGIIRLNLSDQPEDLPEKIQHMVRRYIQQPNTVILCVISAEVDTAVNESVKLAQGVDPDGERTLGVITKPDLTREENKGEKLQLLKNELVNLKKGFIMVKCRSHSDLVRNMSLKEALESEEEFFQNDPVFSDVRKGLLGIPQLSKKLTEELVALIRAKIPEIKTKLTETLSDTKKKLDLLPTGPPSDRGRRMAYLMKAIGEFTKMMEKCLQTGFMDGLFGDSMQNRFKNWRDYFRQFEESINRQTQILLRQRLTHQNLGKMIDEYRGEELTRFLNFDLFKTLVSKHYEEYHGPAEVCLYKLNDDLDVIMRMLIQKHFGTMPQLERQAKILTLKVREEQRKRADEAIKFQFRVENLMFCQDASINDELNKMEEAEKRKELAERKESKYDPNYFYDLVRSEPEPMKNAKELHKMLEAYLEMNNRRIADQIPAFIRMCLHFDFTTKLHDALFELTAEENVADLVEEREDVAGRRHELEKKLQRLEDGIRRLNVF